MNELHFKSAHKLPVYEHVRDEHGLTDDQIMYIGDDVPDTQVMAAAGLAACPADAADDVLECADYITRRPGGHGAVREVIEKILKTQDRWDCPEALEW